MYDTRTLISTNGPKTASVYLTENKIKELCDYPNILATELPKITVYVLRNFLEIAKRSHHLTLKAFVVRATKGTYTFVGSSHTLDLIGMLTHYLDETFSGYCEWLQLNNASLLSEMHMRNTYIAKAVLDSIDKESLRRAANFSSTYSHVYRIAEIRSACNALCEYMSDLNSLEIKQLYIAPNIGLTA